MRQSLSDGQSFQSAAETHIKRAILGRYAAESRIRTRLARWEFDVWPRLMARRVQDNFDCIAAWCHPRISASYLRVVFNGWVTDRRMRTLLAKSGQHRTGCVLGCQAADSLEHYARCKVFWSFATTARPRGLGLTDKGLGNYAQFFGISQSMSKDDIIWICIGTCAAPSQ